MPPQTAAMVSRLKAGASLISFRINGNVRLAVRAAMDNQGERGRMAGLWNGCAATAEEENTRSQKHKTKRIGKFFGALIILEDEIIQWRDRGCCVDKHLTVFEVFMNYVAQRRKTTGSDKEYSAQPYGGSGEKDPDGHFFEGFAMIPPTSVSQPPKIGSRRIESLTSRSIAIDRLSCAKYRLMHWGQDDR